MYIIDNEDVVFYNNKKITQLSHFFGEKISSWVKKYGFALIVKG